MLKKMSFKKSFFINVFILFILVTAVYAWTTFFYAHSTLGNLSPSAVAWDGTTVATSFAGGNGTQANPYQISNGNQLAYFKSLIEGTNYNTYDPLYYVLSADINLGNHSWTAIGITSRTFSGHFDGKGYTIGNFVMTTPVIINSKNYYGLFSQVDGATIENLNINNATITPGYTTNQIGVGTLLGLGNNVTIMNVSIQTSTISLTNFTTASFGNVGGLIGTDVNSSITNSFIDVTITASRVANIGSAVGSLTSTSSSALNEVVIRATMPTGNTGVYGYKDASTTVGDIYVGTITNDVLSLTLNSVSTPKSTVLTLLNSNLNDSYEWYLKANQFQIRTYVAPASVSSNNTGIISDVVYINDMQADYDYYMGLNYTKSSDGTIPTGENQNLYSDNNLASVQITYSGVETLSDSSTLTGYVSTTEQQDKYIYYKTYPINNNGTVNDTSDDYVTIDLIENPFTDRPDDYAFNSWKTDYDGAKIRYDSSYYKRYADVPVSYLNGSPNDVVIDFNASWVTATTSLVNSSRNWSTAFGTLKAAGMQSISFSGTNPTNMSGYYRTVTISNGASYAGYYNSTGVYQTSGTCATTGGCTYYQLIQYYDTYGNPENYSSSETYYYLVTRDTNIVIMTTNLSTIWASAQNKPFTLTSVYNDTDYRSSAMWTISSRSVKCYADTVFENIKIYSAASSGNTSPTSSTTTTRYLYGNFKNVKLGRGITANGTYKNFDVVLGGSNAATGSSSNVTEYSLIIESGEYNTLSVTQGTVSTTATYVEAKATYGSDFDRATATNSNLDIYYCASGSWGGYIYSSSSTTGIAIDLTVKSGTFGSGKYDYSTGIYIGGRSGGTHYAAREITYEGGYTYNLIGGPLTDSGRSNINDTYAYIKGGSIDMVIGGAGTSATYGNRIIQVTGGTVNYSVFGGSNGYQGSSTDGTVNGDTFVYVGGSAIIGLQSYVTNNNTLFGSEAGSVFGIGNGLSGSTTIGSCDNSNIVIDGSATINRNVYGGGNYGATGTSGSSTTNTNITIAGGTIDGSVFGGGNKNGAGSSSILATINLNVTGGTITGSVYGGSNDLGTIYGSTNVNITGGTIANDVYGGGKGGYVSSSSTGTFVARNVVVTVGNTELGTSPNINGSVFGGSAYGTVNGTTNTTNLSSYTTTVNVNKGVVANSIFGGARGNATYTPYVEGNIAVNINGGNVASVFGGNDASGTPNGSVTVDLNGGIIGNSFGGGNNSSVRTNTITLDGATTSNLFGGSNTSGNVTTSTVIINSGTVGNIYGGNNIGGTTTTSNVTINNGTITGDVYGGGKNATTTTSNLTLKGSIITNAFGGGESANVATTHINLQGSTLTNLYGGSNTSGNVTNSNVTITSGTSTNVYGGNNVGGITSTTNVTLTSGTLTNLYGGGNFAATNTNNVIVDGGTVNNIFGGGNNAETTINTILNLTNATVNDSVYAGGKLGNVTGNTYLTIKNSHITNDVYGGGDEADVIGNAYTTVTGTTSIGKSLFGGGNSGTIGNATNNNSLSVVNVTGATIGTNVYGGCNTSVVYGTTDVNIGYDAVGNASLTKGNINIAGTVFGGGEANASGSETYDYSFICVTTAINIDIDGGGYTNNGFVFALTGSIFGSGNASSSSGTSNITISHLGTTTLPSKNISIQRADTVVIDNSVIELSGATDRTNEYSSIKYSFNRVNLLKIKNNSTILLQQNANLLKEVQSLVDVSNAEVKATVSINDETKVVTKNVDNRIYLLANKNLNITTNEAATSYGVVSGMTFFGMYIAYSNGTYAYGLYDRSFDYGDDADAGDVIAGGGSYILGLHSLNHDTSVDGFYSNFINEEYTSLTTAYINPTPPDATYYMWSIGIQSINYSFALTASKYSSLGTFELSLIDFAQGDTIFEVLGFNSEGLSSGVSLVDSNNVPKIASTPEEANSVLGLSMKSETTEWTSYETTKFLSANSGSYTGSSRYKTDSESNASSLMFYLYHAKNISLDANLGTVVITLQALTPVNETDYTIQLITITVDLNARSYSNGDAYDASITYDKKYEMPAATNVDITDQSQFTAYYSLYASAAQMSDFYGLNNNYYHVLVSDYALPVGTTITMIDYGANETNPEYYYYVVDTNGYNAAVAQLNSYNEVTYPLSSFIKMDSTSSGNTYNNATSNNLYYHSSSGSVAEEFIFIVDFKNTTTTGEHLDNSLLFELRNIDDRAVVSVLGIRQNLMTYDLYQASNVVLNQNVTMSNNYIYYMSETTLPYATVISYDQTANRDPIIDTNYESISMGFNASIYDSSNNIISSSLLTGTSITVDGKVYFVDSDGIFRIKLANKVANLTKTIKFLVNSGLPPGNYTLKLVLFASEDGLHNNGQLEDDTKTFSITMVGNENLIVVTSPDSTKIVDGVTGLNTAGINSEVYTTAYNSVLNNPNIRLSLYKRDITTSSVITYTEIDIRTMFSNTFTFPSVFGLTSGSQYEYMVSNSPQSTTISNLLLKANLTSGTYKLVFKLYDRNYLIDKDIEYFIVKKALQ